MLHILRDTYTETPFADWNIDRIKIQHNINDLDIFKLQNCVKVEPKFPVMGAFQSILQVIKQNLPFLTAITIPVLSYLAYKAFPYIQPLFSPLRKTNQHGGELVAKVFKAHKVKYVFTLVGGHISPILVAAKQEGIQVVDVRSECTTVFAADAVSRLSGTPGVAIVTAGPGVTNTITVN